MRDLPDEDDRFKRPDGAIRGWVPRVNICKLDDVLSYECNCNTSVGGSYQDVNHMHETILGE
ncbi:hypothetical protein HBNXHr_1686 [Halorhabdus sp. BNX81]|nr:hypothetical protein HBNXHr_1686 [Halorhabdus sp. BNX81]